MGHIELAVPGAHLVLQGRCVAHGHLLDMTLRDLER